MIERLQEFQKAHKVFGKGPLALVLHISRVARTEGLPLNVEAMKTERQGQVKGLGKAAVQKILSDYGIDRVLAEEGGRTSRGAMGIMPSYVIFLNELKALGLDDLPRIESWWVDKVREHFAAKPFSLKYEVGKSFGEMIRDLFSQAETRQREVRGATLAGTVLQHLVAAKLSIVAPDSLKEIHGAAVADGPTSRGGDFLLHDVVIHCTTSASEGLMQKCQRNIESGQRPIIITLSSRVNKAESMIEDYSLKGRVEVWDIEQFLSTNIYELSGFQAVKRKPTLERLVDAYNKIVAECETDPSLKIELG